jgi:hypothetical protein
MVYRALKPLRWGGAMLSPSELLAHIPGRRYEAMLDRGEVEVVMDPEPEHSEPFVVEAPKKPRGRPPKVRTEGAA